MCYNNPTKTNKLWHLLFMVAWAVLDSRVGMVEVEAVISWMMMNFLAIASFASAPLRMSHNTLHRGSGRKYG